VVLGELEQRALHRHHDSIDVAALLLRAAPHSGHHTSVSELRICVAAVGVSCCPNNSVLRCMVDFSTIFVVRGRRKRLL
jgi:hypothetical protein